MASNDPWEEIRAEITRMLNDDDYQLFHKRLESLVHLANATVAGTNAVQPEEIKGMLNAIKNQYVAFKSGRDPLELGDQILNQAGLAIDRDLHLVAGDRVEAQGDAFKIQIENFFAEGKKEIKEELPFVMIPFVLAVMTAEEAQQLNAEAVFADYQDPIYYQEFQTLLSRLPAERRQEVLTRYGAKPEDWRPFGNETIADLINTAFAGIEDVQKPLRPMFIDIRQFTGQQPHATRILWKELRDDGCIVIIDAISMHHPVIQLACRRSLLDVYPNTAVIKVGPADSVLEFRQQLLRFREYSPDLEIYRRIYLDLDPNCQEVTRLINFQSWIRNKAPMILNDRVKRRAQKNPQTVYKEANRSNG